MQKKKSRRINFKIIQCTSEETDHPVSQLQLQSPNAKGWQSKRFCQYPQIIIYQLNQPTIVKQISILSHQSKIATKIVIHNKLQGNNQWNRLGFISLQSNVNSNYQARQLKTVNVHDKPSSYLRFSFQGHYVNNHNLFNQIGVISLCIFGDFINIGYQNQITNQPINQQIHQPITTQLDKNTEQKIKMLQLQKKQALQKQNYDRAQILKNQIQKLKNFGKNLMLLQIQKKKAIESEHYQDAKIINQKIKKLKDSQGLGSVHSVRPTGTPAQYTRQKPQHVQERTPSDYARQKPQHVQEIQPPLSPQTKKKQQKQEQIGGDERPINIRSSNPYQNAEDEGGPTETEIYPNQIDKLPKQIREQCVQYFNIFNQQIFSHIFSNNHTHRQKGINMIKDELSRISRNKNEISQACLYIIKKLIDDKNISVLINILELFYLIMKKFKPNSNHHLPQFIDQILQKSNDYLGHSNQKVKKIMEQIYSNLPSFQLTNKQICYASLAKIGKRQKPPKILSARLKMLNQLITNYQLGKNYQNVIKYAIKYADDKSNDVRNAAIQLICTISSQIGYQTVQPFLKNLRPPILKSIQQKCSHNQNYQDCQNLNMTRKSSQPQKIPIKHKKQQFQAAQNQFIQVPPPKNITNPQFMCDFCQKFDKKFQNQDYKDLHLYNACPMIMICQQCSQAVQISTYTAHQVGECKNSKYFKRCPRCKEAVHQSTYKSHVQKKQCLPSKPPASANRCPLCHFDIDPGKQGWKAHLVDTGCQGNPRK